MSNRKRTARACDSCFKRKIKCDAAIPLCNWCEDQGISCTFDRTRSVRRGKKNSVGRENHLVERLNCIDRILGASDPITSDVLNGPYDLILPNTDEMSIFSAESSVISSWRHRSLTDLSLSITASKIDIALLFPGGGNWALPSTYYIRALSQLYTVGPAWEERHELFTSVLCPGSMDRKMTPLPEQAIVEELALAYETSATSYMFPVADMATLRKLVKTAYKPSYTECPTWQAAKACIFSFVCFCCVLRLPLKTTLIVEEAAYAQEAFQLLSCFAHSTSSLDGLQAAITLTMYEIISGRLKSVDSVFSIAVHHLFELGIHSSASLSRTSSSVEMKKTVIEATCSEDFRSRTLFWLCYVVDKDISLRTGRRPLIDDELCDLTLPYHFVHGSVATSGLKSCNLEDQVYDLYPTDLRLSILKSHVYTRLFSTEASQKSDSSMIQAIREMDEELERWRLSIRQPDRPTLFFSRMISRRGLSTTRAAMLQLEYHRCLILIHQASNRCTTRGHLNSTLIQAVNSSLRLSVEASRSTLSYFERVSSFLHSNVCWVIIFYPLSALVTIALNIRANPSDIQSQKDVRLFETALVALDQVSRRRRLENENDTSQSTIIAEFVTELEKIAKQAVEIAQRPNNV